MTSFVVCQFLKYKGNHEVDIIVIDNSFPDTSINELLPIRFKLKQVIPNFYEDKVSSHGVALDWGIEATDNEWVICAESDSFPTEDGYLNYYENLVNMGVDAAGSLLRLSGGEYLHPCGALYRKSVWQEAKAYVDTIPYNYYPNFMMRDNFPVHTMIHKSLVEEVENNPQDWVELSSEYKDRTKETMREKLAYYSPVGCGVFHNGMGGRQESLRTYGQRTAETDAPSIILNDKNQKIIGRLGFEPGQFLHYYMVNQEKKIFHIPTETKWMPGKENQQQEYTINEAGIKHLWAGTSYLGMKDTSQNDIYEFKKNQIEDLYNRYSEFQTVKDDKKFIPFKR